MNAMMAAVVVASNRAAAGVYEDTTGPLIVDLRVENDGVAITASVRTTDRTGVEMEALTAVSVAALTVVDMVKAVDKAAVITDVRVESKTGGKSGDWSRA